MITRKNIQKIEIKLPAIDNEQKPFWLLNIEDKEMITFYLK